jgi:UDP-glucose 4-epimerase
MPIIMKVSTGEIKELCVYGDDYDTPDGTCMRDYIHVVDLARGHVAAIEKMKPGVSIYNLGTGKATSVLEMVVAFEKASGEKLAYKIVGRRAGDLPKIFANPKKAKEELGWETELTIEDAMNDTINYLKHDAERQ